MSPAGLHNSRERGGWSTPLPRSRSSSPSRSRGATSKDRENQRRSRDICRRYARGSPHNARLFPPEFRGHNKTTVLPAGRTAILSPPLSLSLFLFALLASSCSLLVCLSPVPAGRLSPVPVAPLLASFSRHQNQQKSMRRNMRPDTRIFRCTDRTFTFSSVFFIIYPRVNLKLLLPLPFPEIYIRFGNRGKEESFEEGNLMNLRFEIGSKSGEY